MTSTKQYKLLSVKMLDNIALVTLTRPAKRNAINLDLVSELNQCFQSFSENVKAIILNSEGDHFCAGLDLVVGGGLELASATHIRIAESTAFYALPEGKRGLFVGGGGSVRISRLIGVNRMTDLMLTGRVLNAEEGQQIGVSTYLTEPGKGLDKALELAKGIASNAEMTNYAVMHMLPRIADQNIQDGLATEP